MKIISKAYALKLVKNGNAKIETELVPNDRGIVYVAISRYDTQETAHYKK